MIETVMHKFFFSEGSVSLKKSQTEADGFRVSESYFAVPHTRLSTHYRYAMLSSRATMSRVTQKKSMPTNYGGIMLRANWSSTQLLSPLDLLA